jgi:hypothetical protein
MPEGVGEHPSVLRVGLMLEFRGAQRQHRLLGAVEVVHAEVQVRLHGRGRVGPRRWLVAGRALERQMKRRGARGTESAPVGLGEHDQPAGQTAVEGGELDGIPAFKGDAAEARESGHVRHHAWWTERSGDRKGWTTVD